MSAYHSILCSIYVVSFLWGSTIVGMQQLEVSKYDKQPLLEELQLNIQELQHRLTTQVNSEETHLIQKQLNEYQGVYNLIHLTEQSEQPKYQTKRKKQHTPVQRFYAKNALKAKIYRCLMRLICCSS